MSLKCSGNEKHSRTVVRNLNGARGCPAKDHRAKSRNGLGWQGPLKLPWSKPPAVTGTPSAVFPGKEFTLGPASDKKSPNSEESLGLAEATGSQSFLAGLRLWLPPQRGGRLTAAQPANTPQPRELPRGNPKPFGATQLAWSWGRGQVRYHGKCPCRKQPTLARQNHAAGSRPPPRLGMGDLCRTDFLTRSQRAHGGSHGQAVLEAATSLLQQGDRRRAAEEGREELV